MNTFKALAWIASGHLKARADRRTANLIDALPETVQKDIGWKWTSSKRDPGVKSFLGFDLI